MTFDIQAIVDQKIQEMHETGTIQTMLETGIEKTVRQVIDDTVNSYSLRSRIGDALEKEVSAAVKETGFTTYNGFIADTIKDIMNNVVKKDLQEKIKAKLESILINKHDKIKLSEILQKYQDFALEDDDDSEKYEFGEYKIEINQRPSRGWFHIKLDEKTDSPNYRSSGYSLTISSSSKTASILSAYKEGVDVKNLFHQKYLNDFDAFLLSIVYNNTPIEIDIEEAKQICTSYDVDDE